MASRKLWTEEDIAILTKMFVNDVPYKGISKKLNRTVGSICNKVNKLNLESIHIRSNSSNFKAIYQDYDWCYDQVITQGKSLKRISEETGFSVRVLKKWTREVHGLSNRTYRKLATLTPLQYSLILAGTLGDGHIDKREKYAIYIESHAENQKDYLFWKYKVLKNLCWSEPRYSESKIKTFNDKEYLCQPTYRLETRAIDELKKIRNMSRIEKIKQLDELGFCTHMLDDAYRSDSSWELCFGDWLQDEINTYMKYIEEMFNFHPYQCNDKRYAKFNSDESKKIDELILKNIPNDLDVIKYKITERKAA